MIFSSPHVSTTLRASLPVDCVHKQGKPWGLNVGQRCSQQSYCNIQSQLFLIRGSRLSLYTDVQQYNVVLVAAIVKNKNRVPVWPHPLIQRKHRKSFACSCVYDMHAHAHCGRWSIEILTAMSQSHHMRIAVGDLFLIAMSQSHHWHDQCRAGSFL